MGRGALFMLESVPFCIAVGLVLGFLAGMGVGGGSLLILWLTLILQIDAGMARAINLMFFIAAAGSVSLFRWRKGTLDLRSILPAVIAGCAAAALCSNLRSLLDESVAEKLFGILLLVTGFRELLYRPRKAR